MHIDNNYNNNSDPIDNIMLIGEFECRILIYYVTKKSYFIAYIGLFIIYYYWFC